MPLIGIVFIHSIIILLILNYSFFSGNLLIFFLSILIGPITFATKSFCLKIARGANPPFDSFKQDFKKYKTALLVYFFKTLFVYLGFLLFIIPGIIASLAFSQVSYILADDTNEEWSSLQILSKSNDLMDGYKMDYFILMITFFLYSVVCLLTLGIAYIWLNPYIEVTTANFYLKIKNEIPKYNLSN